MQTIQHATKKYLYIKKESRFTGEFSFAVDLGFQYLPVLIKGMWDPH